MSNNQRQQLYRERHARMKAALIAIRAQLDGSTKDAALKILATVEEGLR